MMKTPSREKIRKKVKSMDELDRIIAEAKSITSGSDSAPWVARIDSQESSPTQPEQFGRADPGDSLLVSAESELDRSATGGRSDSVPAEDQLSLRFIGQLVMDRWRLIAAVTVVAVTIALIFTATITPIYESTSVLLIRLGRESIYRSAIGERQTVVNRDREAQVNAEVEILLSSDLHTDLVQDIGVETLYPDLAEARSEIDPSLILSSGVSRLKENVFVRAKPEANVISVSFRHHVPTISYVTTNRLVELFKERHLEVFSDQHSTQFLEHKVAEHRKRLEETEETLEEAQAMNVAVIDQDVRRDYLTRRGELVAVHKEALSRVAGLREKINYLEQRNLGAGSEVLDDPQRANAIDRATETLLELRLQEKELRSKYTETSRHVTRVREQIRVTEEFLEEQKKEAQSRLPQNLVDAKAEYLFHEARANTLEQQLERLDRELAEIPAIEKRLRNLTRNRDNAEENYHNYLQRLEDARLSDEMDQEKIGNISVIQEATMPIKPVRPSKRVNFIVGAFVGLVLGLGLALLMGPRSSAKGTELSSSQTKDTVEEVSSPKELDTSVWESEAS